MTGLVTISKLKLDTNSFLRADREFVECYGALPSDQYAEMYFELTGKALNEDDDKKAELKTRYVIQTFIKNIAADVDEVVNMSTVQFNRYWEINSYLYADRSESQAVVEVQRKDGSTVVRTRRNDGLSKQDVAQRVYVANRTKGLSRQEWIALLVKEVELTPAGASTYLSNLKQKHGDVTIKVKK
jgi:hypothetical protein